MAIEANDEGLIGDLVGELPGDLVVIDDGSALIDPVTFVDPMPIADEGIAITDENMVVLESEWSTDFQPKEDVQADDAGADGAAPADAGDDIAFFTTDVVVTDGEYTDGGEPVIYTMTGEEGEIATDGGEGDGATDGSIDGTDEFPGRPVDPMPNWRTLTGDAGSEDAAGDDAPVDESGTDTGTDVGTGDFSYEDFIAIYEKDPVPAGDDGTPPVVYTMGADDPLIYANTAPSGETPGRNSDPLPYERTLDSGGSAPHSVPESEPEIDRTPVSYAAADSFHTGIDLL
jgi:hypothetical protein